MPRVSVPVESLFASHVFSFHALTANAASGNPMMVNSIVLGVNLDPTEKQFSFPCHTAAATDLVFCDNTISIEEPQCAATLGYKSIAPKVLDIYCRLKTGQVVVIARAQGELVNDSTQSDFGYVKVRMNPAFSLQSVPSPSHARYVLKFK